VRSRGSLTIAHRLLRRQRIIVHSETVASAMRDGERAAQSDLAGAEGIIQWVTQNLARFAFRSIPNGVEFRGATVTSDAGLLLPRELDERLGLDALIERHVTDPRTGHNRQSPLADLFRQSIYGRLGGYEDINDAERLADSRRTNGTRLP